MEEITIIADFIRRARTSDAGVFMYFIFAVPKTSQHFSPYHLKLVPFEKLDKSSDYLTISCNGVTYFGVNKEPELVRLNDWEQEYEYYAMLKKIRFYKHFLIWRIFCKWRKSVARRKFSFVHDTLLTELIPVNQILGPALQNCQAVCSHLEDMGFNACSFSQTVTLDEFAYYQTVQLNDIEISLHNFREMLKETLIKACQDSYQKEGFSINLSRPTSTSRSNSDASPIQGIVPKSNRNNLSYVDQDKKRNLSIRLIRFLQRADYVIQNSLFKLLVNSVELLVQVIRERYRNLDCSETNNLIPLCFVELTMNSDQLEVQPSEEDVKSSFLFIMRSWEKCVLSFEPFLSDHTFRPFFQEMQQKGPCLDLIVQKDEHLENLRSEMLSMLENNFKHVHQVVVTYESIAKSFVDNKNTHVESIKKETDLDIFRVMLLNFVEQQTEVDKVVSTQSFGIFLLQLENFQSAIIPCLQELRHAVHESLPKVGRAKLLTLSTEVQDAQAFLELLPKTTSNYVEYLKFLDEMPQQLNRMTNEMNYIEKLHEIMKEFSVPCLKEDLSSFLAFKTGIESLNIVVEKRLSERDVTMNQFEREMCKDIDILLIEVEEVQNAVNESSLVDVDSDVEEVQLALQQLHNRLDEAQNKANYYQEQQKTYHLNIPECKELAIAKDAVYLRQLLWDSLEIWENKLEDWESQVFHSLDPDEVAATIEKNTQIICQLESGLTANQVVNKYKNSLNNMTGKLPVIRHLRNPSLELRHWCDIGKLVGHDLGKDEALTLRLLEEMEVFKYLQPLQEISNQATCEANLNAMLNNVESQWQSLEFQIETHNDTYILGDTNHVQEVVDDTYLSLGTISSSKFADPIRPRVETWKKNLELFGVTLDEWIQCQEKWCLLGKMFQAADIKRKLILESSMFEAVNKSWISIMSYVIETPAALKTCTRSGLLSELKKNNNVLKQIIKYMKSYLESKRARFPRFYFTSDDELLDILSKPKNMENLQAYLQKWFLGIYTLNYKQSSKDYFVISMLSKQQEEITFEKAIKVTERFEEWLSNVESSMKESIRKLIKNLVPCFNQSILQWIKEYPQQVIYTVSYIKWCKQIEECLVSSCKNLAFLIDEYSQENEAICTSMQNNDEATLHSRILCSSIISLNIHFKNVVKDLIDKNISASSNFEWQKQLRLYWCDLRSQCEIRMGISTFQYGYEYVANCPDIAWTTTSDRCIFSILNALNLNFGAHLASSPGCGKKEMIKTLALIVSVNYILLPCSQSIKFKTILQLLCGVSQTGSWCCFSDSHKLDGNVLSTTAHKISSILQARRSKQTRFVLQGRELKFHPNFAIFMTTDTLNSSNILKLPDNLKCSFRPISLPQIENSVVAEILLASQSFTTSKILASKLSNIFSICKEQLGQSNSYCFDSRNMKQIIRLMTESYLRDQTENEEKLLHHTLRQVIVPRLLPQDAATFMIIMRENFGEFPQEITAVDFETAIQKGASYLNITLDANVIENTMTLHHIIESGQCSLITGQTGSGKTTVWKLLQSTLCDLSRNSKNYKSYHMQVIYPQSLTWGDLYGEKDEKNVEWRNGLFQFAHKSRKELQETKIIVFDGNLNAEWMEGLGTYLEEDGVACLGNLEQIKSSKDVKLLFESSDLSNVSPSIISRCNILHIDDKKDPWLLFETNLFQNLNVTEDHKNTLKKLFSENIPRAFEFFSNSNFQLSIICIVTTLSKMIKSLLSSTKNEHNNIINLKNIFIFCFIWSFIACLADSRSITLFAEFIKDLFKEDIHCNDSDDILNKYWSLEEQSWCQWDTMVSQISTDPQCIDDMIPTKDFVKFGYLAELLLSANQPVIFMGPSGCGKSMLARWVLHKLGRCGQNVTVPVSLSVHVNLQRELEKKLERRRRGVLGAPRGKRVIFHVDDVNIGQNCDNQSPLELLRQVFDHKGIYERSNKKISWTKIEDVLITAICNEIDPLYKVDGSRFLRHFTIISLPHASKDTLLNVYGTTLKQHLNGSNLGPEAASIVDICISTYERIRSKFFPVPNRLHYIVTQRCLARCTKGIMRIAADSLTDLNILIKLTYHELLREFGDRTISDDDKNCVKQIINEELMLKFEKDVVNKSLPAPFSMFADFLMTKKGNYSHIEISDTLITVLQEHLEAYNEYGSKNKMRLLIFEEFADHVVRVARALQFRSGHVLMLGCCGSGRRSIAEFAAYLCGHRFITFNILPNMNINQFETYMQEVCFTAVTSKQDTVFIVSDNKMMPYECLRDLSVLIKLGNAPFLCMENLEEKVRESVHDEIKDFGKESYNVIFSLFINKLKRKLHIVLCLDVDGENYSQQLNNFPELSACCFVNWVPQWSTESLIAIAKYTFRNIDVDENTKQDLESYSAKIHEDAMKLSKDENKQFDVTINMYIEMLQLFETMYKSKLTKLLALRDKCSNGLKKLNETMETTEEMRQQLASLEPQLREKSAATEACMKSLLKEQSQVEKVRQAVAAEELSVKIKSDETHAMASEAQKDIEEAIPAIEASVKALETVERNDLKDIRGMSKPPQLVKFVFEAVCLLMGCKTDWGSIKTLTGDSTFIKRAMELDKDNIPETVVRKLKEYVEHPNFLPEIMETQSRACRSFCMWVRAVDGYTKTFRAVLPKKKRLESAEAELSTAMSVLRAKQQRLAETEGQIARLETQYDTSLAEQGALQAAVELTTTRLTRAGNLAATMQDEHNRWETALQEYSDQLNNLPRNVLLCATSIIYLGAYDSEKRTKMIKIWLSYFLDNDISTSSTFSLKSTLSNPYEIQSWQNSGLPKDEFAIENAIITVNTITWPLILDPHGQGVSWIKQIESSNGLLTTSITESNYTEIIKTGIEENKPVLLQDISEYLPLQLTEILKDNTKFNAMLKKDNKFKLYLTCSSSEPNFHTDIYIYLTIINFSNTYTALEEIILSKVVQMETHEIEQQIVTVELRMRSDRREQDSLEQSILDTFCNLKGDLLDNEALINTLNKNKIASDVININLEKQEGILKGAQARRENYRPVATRGALLFTDIAHMGKLNVMYQCSLEFFLKIFYGAIKDRRKSDEDVPQQISQLENIATRAVFNAIIPGLNADDKLVFSFLVCCSIVRKSGMISNAELSFITIIDDINNKNNHEMSNSEKVKTLEESFDNFKTLGSLLKQGIKITVGNLSQVLQEPVDNEVLNIEEEFNDTLTDFQKLILIKNFKIEQLIITMHEFIKVTLGSSYLLQKHYPLKGMVSGMKKLTPLVFILGKDPTLALSALATEHRFFSQENGLCTLAMAAGQEEVALKLVRKGMAEGLWIFLQNCHVSSAWLKNLIQLIKHMWSEPNTVSDSFRLFLSSKPTQGLPSLLLQHSIKLSTDLPRNFNTNVTAALSNLKNDFIEDHAFGSSWSRLILGLCHFDLILRERSYFGASACQFAGSSLDCSIQIAQKVCMEEEKAPLDTLIFYIGNIIYGNQLDNKIELSDILNLLQNLITPRNLLPANTRLMEVPESLFDVSAIPNLISNPILLGQHQSTFILHKKQEFQQLLHNKLKIGGHNCE